MTLLLTNSIVIDVIINEEEATISAKFEDLSWKSKRLWALNLKFAVLIADFLTSQNVYFFYRSYYLLFV